MSDMFRRRSYHFRPKEQSRFMLTVDTNQSIVLSYDTAASLVFEARFCHCKLSSRGFQVSVAAAHQGDLGIGKYH